MKNRVRVLRLSGRLVCLTFLLPRIFCADCNKNGRDDATEVQENASLDCNRNGAPDDCDLTVPRLAFREARHFATSPEPLGVYLADVDSDGDLDAIAPLERTTDVAVLFNKGGSLSSPLTFSVPSKVWAVASADFDGDGDVDLAIANGEEKHIGVPGSPGAVTVLANDGHGIFDFQFQLELADSPSSITAADVDGDGHVDLMATTHGDPESRISGTLWVFRNEGDGIFLEPAAYPVGLGPSEIITADLNQDGLLDAAVVHDASGKVAVLLNKTRGIFEDVVFFSVWVDPANGDDVARSSSRRRAMWTAMEMWICSFRS